MGGLACGEVFHLVKDTGCHAGYSISLSWNQTSRHTILLHPLCTEDMEENVLDGKDGKGMPKDRYDSEGPFGLSEGEVGREKVEGDWGSFCSDRKGDKANLEDAEDAYS